MHRYTKLLLTSLAATAILALAISSASANRLSATGGRLWRVTWTSLRFTSNFSSATILCPVTLEGSFHSATILKTAGSLIGFVTRASVRSPCTGGRASVNQGSLPWHIRYRSFTGTLPRLSGATFGLVGAEFEIEPNNGQTCRVRTEAGRPAVGTINIEAGGVATGLTPDPNTRIGLREGSFGCGIASGFFEATSQTPTELGTGARITITLI